MKFQIVEPTRMCGVSSRMTDTTLIVASNDYGMKHLNSFNEIWVDNGAFEQGVGNPVSFGDVLVRQIEYCNSLQYDSDKNVYFIMPDVLMSYEKTQYQIQKYERKINHELSDGVHRVGVLQCLNKGHVKQMLKYYDNIFCNTLSIPIKVREYWYKHHPKDDIWQIITENSDYGFKNIHNLGFSLQDMNHKNFYKCHSFDTSYPLKCLAVGLEFGQDARRPENYFELKLNRVKSQKAIHDFIEYIGWNDE